MLHGPWVEVRYDGDLGLLGGALEQAQKRGPGRLGGVAGNTASKGRGQVVLRFARESAQAASSISSATLPRARPIRA